MLFLSSPVAQRCSPLLPNAWNWVFLGHNCVFNLFLKCSPLTWLWAHQFSSYPPHHQVSSTLPRWGYIFGEEHWNAAQQLLGLRRAWGEFSFEKGEEASQCAWISACSTPALVPAVLPLTWQIWAVFSCTQPSPGCQGLRGELRMEGQWQFLSAEEKEKNLNCWLRYFLVSRQQHSWNFMKSPLCCVVAITVTLIYTPCPSPDVVYTPPVKVLMISCLLLHYQTAGSVLDPPPSSSSCQMSKTSFFFSVFVSEIFHLSQLFVSIHGLTVSNSELAQSNLSFCIIWCPPDSPGAQGYSSQGISLWTSGLSSQSLSPACRGPSDWQGSPSGLSQDIGQKNKCRFFQNEVTVGKLSDEWECGCSTSMVLML